MSSLEMKDDHVMVDQGEHTIECVTCGWSEVVQGTRIDRVNRAFEHLQAEHRALSCQADSVTAVMTKVTAIGTQ